MSNSYRLIVDYYKNNIMLRSKLREELKPVEDDCVDYYHDSVKLQFNPSLKLSYNYDQKIDVANSKLKDSEDSRIRLWSNYYFEKENSLNETLDRMINENSSSLTRNVFKLCEILDTKMDFIYGYRHQAYKRQVELRRIIS
jgi:hypothetical protein